MRRTIRTELGSPVAVNGRGRTVSMPKRLPKATSVRYLSPIIIKRFAGHLREYTANEGSSRR